LRVTAPMRPETLKTVCRIGAHSATTQASAKPNCALATVMVKTAAGSKSAAPETISGTILRDHFVVEGVENGSGLEDSCARVLIAGRDNRDAAG
jgi:hypothetical protein